MKKLLLLAVAPDMSENSHNLSQILNLLGIEAVEDVTGDIKICEEINVFNQHIYFFFSKFTDGVVLGKAGGQQTYGCFFVT